MKAYLLLLPALLLLVAIDAELFKSEYIGLQYTGPESLQVTATLLTPDTWIGSASMVKDGHAISMRIYDMAYDPDLNSVTICPGTTEDDFYCQTFEYAPGAAARLSDGRGGVAEYNVNIFPA
ncbi:MAG: hypothetical protein ABH863_04170 [Candidatus Micrarchaeota archaeon]